MKKLAVALVICVFVACKDPATGPQPSTILATEPVAMGGGGSGSSTPSPDLKFWLSMHGGPDTSRTRYTLFAQAIIRDGDEGRVLVANANNEPDFSAFAMLLTDGIDESIAYTSGLPTIGFGGTAENESAFFVGRPGAGPDFAGYAIDSIEFAIDSVWISPGHVKYDLMGRVLVAGHRSDAGASGRGPS